LYYYCNEHIQRGAALGVRRPEKRDLTLRGRVRVSALRRLVLYQNVFYLRALFDQAQKGAENTFGITD
jgi:hypothetical protein